jgi:hypothetical protein
MLGGFMGKTISLKLSSSEEEIINNMLIQGISPSKLLRSALSNYLDLINEKVNQKVNLFQQEENSFFDEKVNQKVNLFNRSEVNPVNQKVNRSKEKEVNLEVNQNDFFSENKEEKKVNQKVNLVNQFEEKYLNLYIEQLKDRVNQLEKESQELKDKNKISEQFLLNNYQIIQDEYYNLVKDTIKKLDDKFDRIMFYLEGSVKKPDYHVNLKSDVKEKHNKDNSSKFINKKVTEESGISVKKPRKGWIFQMYRM